jgi:hypothetical protein
MCGGWFIVGGLYFCDLEHYRPIKQGIWLLTMRTCDPNPLTVTMKCYGITFKEGVLLDAARRDGSNGGLLAVIGHVVLQLLSVYGLVCVLCGWPEMGR